MTDKEIIERAEKALYMFDNSNGRGDVSMLDLLFKVNETLRLIKALAERNVKDTPNLQ